MQPMRRSVLVVVLSASCLAACGPIAYVSEVTRHASRAVDDARAAHADTLSPYYWTRAVTFLHMAREVAGHADFQGANRFGRLASESAEKATAEAEEFTKDPSKRPYLDEVATPKDAAKPIAPAKDSH